jgi:hypothetical protein
MVARAWYSRLAPIRRLKGADRGDPILAAIRIGPGHRLADRRLFKPPADAGLVDLVHAPADGAAYDNPDHGATDRGHRAIRALTDLRADDAGGDAPEHKAERPAIATTQLDTDVGRVAVDLDRLSVIVVLLAVAVRWLSWRRPARQLHVGVCRPARLSQL